MKKEEFYVGQRIKQKLDEGDGPQWFYGHVKAINEDNIVIKWPDLDEPVKHFSDEWESIKNGIPTVE